MKNIYIFSILMVFFFLSSSSVHAQQKTRQQEVSVEVEGDREGQTYRIKVSTEEDGSKRSFEKSYGSLEEMESDSAVTILMKGDMDQVFDIRIDSLNDTFRWVESSDSSGHRVVRTKGGTMIIIDETEIPDDQNDQDTSLMIHQYKIKISENDEMEDAQKKLEKEVFVFRDEQGKITIHTGKPPAMGETEVRQVSLSEITLTDSEFSDFNLDELPGLNLKNLNYYPNPNQGEFTLSFTAAKKPVIVRILDRGGNLKFEEIIRDFDGSYSRVLDVKNYDKGSYLLQVHQRGKVMNRKISIQ